MAIPMRGPKYSNADPRDYIPPDLPGFSDFTELGEGSFGVVWKARELPLSRDVAIKCLRHKLNSDPKWQSSFLEEARKMARLPKHENRVEVHQAETSESTSYFVMQYIKGDSLQSVVKKHGPLPWPQAVRFILDAARALEDVHAMDFVHRDIKPANLLLDEQLDQAVLTDFGIAAQANVQAQKSGSNGYFAPEVLTESKPIFKSDVYSLAATMFHLLIGHPPESARNPLFPFPEPEVLSGVPSAVSEIIHGGLSKRLDSRPDLRTLIEQLNEARWCKFTSSLETAEANHQPDIDLVVTMKTASNDNPSDFRVRSSSNRIDVETHDVVRFDAHATQRGLISIWHGDKTGRMASIFSSPNLEAQQNVQVDFKTAPPSGEEIFVVVWSPIDTSDKAILDELYSIGDSTDSGPGSRPVPTRAVNRIRHKIGDVPTGKIVTRVFQVRH